MYQKFVLEKYLFSEILADHLPISKREGWGSLFARFLDVDIWKIQVWHIKILYVVKFWVIINLVELNLYICFFVVVAGDETSLYSIT